LIVSSGLKYKACTESGKERKSGVERRGRKRQKGKEKRGRERKRKYQCQAVLHTI